MERFLRKYFVEGMFCRGNDLMEYLVVGMFFYGILRAEEMFLEGLLSGRVGHLFFSKERSVLCVLFRSL